MWCVPASLSNTAMASPSWSFSGKKKRHFFFLQPNTCSSNTKNKKHEGKIAMVVNQPHC